MGMLGRLIAHKDDLLGCLTDYNANNVALQQLPCFIAIKFIKIHPSEHGLRLRYRCVNGVH